MDAMDILGDLLGRKTSKPSRGTDILKDVFRRGSQPSKSSPSVGSGDINQEAQKLEDLLNVAQNRSARRNTGSSQTNPPRQSQSLPPQASLPNLRKPSVTRNQNSDDERAVVLIRAMVNAAKADGKFDTKEQEKIMNELGSRSRENMDFLRKELADSLNVQDFVRSVPIGMEQQVYSMSLIAIDVDKASEADYLSQLADSLRIPMNVREQIHRRLGVPS